MLTSATEITTLLHQARGGDRSAENLLFERVYPELRRLARRYMVAERQGHTLQPTALVHEACLKILGGGAVDWNDRAHFLAVVSSQMRRALVDHGREFRAAKRGYGLKVVLDEAAPDGKSHAPGKTSHLQDVELIDELLTKLKKVDPSAAAVTEMKFFGGLTDEEVAGVLKISHSSVRRHWKFARVWLQQKISESEVDQKPGPNPLKRARPTASGA
jgi:RNA polymerase sigma-70 factor, ECF subfamily